MPSNPDILQIEEPTDEAPKCPECDVPMVYYGSFVSRVEPHYEYESWRCPECGKYFSI